MISLSDLKSKRAAMTQGEWEAIDEFVYDVNRAIVEALRSDADATGIVATHNAADVLIEIAEAALELERANDAMLADDSNNVGLYDACSRAAERFDAALAKVKP